MKKPLSTTHPGLAAKLVDAALADQLTYGSTKKVEWHCDLGHIWSASPNTRTTMGSGCPVCAGKTVLVGFNDLGSQNPQLAAQLADPSLASTLTPRSGKKVEWLCPKGHTWTASVNTRAAGHGCAVCTSKKVVPGVNDLATTHPTIAAQLADPAQATTVTAFSARKLLWACGQGHTWLAPVARLTNGSSCPYCSGLKAITGQTDMASTHPALAAQLVDTSLSVQLKAQSNKKVDWICGKGHIWSVSPNARAKGSGCPVCANRTVLPGFNDLGTTHPSLALEAVGNITRLSRGSHKLVTWRCRKGHEWSAKPVNRTAKRSGCPTCAAESFISQGERDIVTILNALLPDEEVRTTVRNLIQGELDIVLPARRFAVEFNGTFFHNELTKRASYHRDKTVAVRDAGLRLFQIWSDDWKDRQQLVIRALAHRLNATHRLVDTPGSERLDPRSWQRVMARKLILTDVTGAQAAAFHGANHIQGPVSATRHFGLEEADGTLRSVLSLRSPRASARQARVEGAWEVVRYSTLGAVAGGFTKLLAHAEKALKADGAQLTQWVSFSDNMISDGEMYAVSGFVVDGHLRPDYKYVGNRTSQRREPKEAYQRKRFRDDPTLVWDEAWTEHEAALANGLYRVYDAGKTRWIKNV